MKRWGRKTGVLLLSVALLLVVGVTAWPSSVNEIDLTPAELVARVVAAHQGIESFQCEMSMSLHMVNMVGRPRALLWDDMSMSGTRIGVFDLLNERMRRTETRQVHVPLAIKQCQPPVLKVVNHRKEVMYFIDGRLYTLHMIPEFPVGVEPVPVDQPVPVVLQQAVWEEMRWNLLPVPVDQFVQLLKAAEVELQGTEVVRGIDSFVISLVPDMEKLWETAARKKETQPQVMQRGEFREVSITLWICKDTFLPVREYMRWTWDYDWTTTTETTTYYHSFNEPVSIVLPPEAADGVKRRPPPLTIEDFFRDYDFCDVGRAVMEELMRRRFEECHPPDDALKAPPPPPLLTIEEFKDLRDLYLYDDVCDDFREAIKEFFKELLDLDLCDDVREAIKEFFEECHPPDDALKVPPPPSQ